MTFVFTAAICPHTQDRPMTNEIDTSDADKRSRQLIACIEDLLGSPLVLCKSMQNDAHSLHGNA
jgi:hypothetical protein